ncbi:MAG TPA: YcgN family cysteine cluster protein [Anaerolinea sp.]|nr:YcgN family cysteine cluster protein [Anaerolinea sp.]
MALEHEYWKKKTLAEMNAEEWEALCDGCARCCLYKLQDEDTNEIYYTNVICRLLDTYRCRCTDYPHRSKLVPTCLVLDAELVPKLSWMPKTCAYRLVAEGKDLEWWHPLVSGSADTVHKAGISVRQRVIPEKDADMDNLEDYIVDWLE